MCSSGEPGKKIAQIMLALFLMPGLCYGASGFSKIVIPETKGTEIGYGMSKDEDIIVYDLYLGDNNTMMVLNKRPEDSSKLGVASFSVATPFQSRHGLHKLAALADSALRTPDLKFEVTAAEDSETRCALLWTSFNGHPLKNAGQRLAVSVLVRQTGAQEAEKQHYDLQIAGIFQSKPLGGTAWKTIPTSEWTTDMKGLKEEIFLTVSRRMQN